MLNVRAFVLLAFILAVLVSALEDSADTGKGRGGSSNPPAGGQQPPPGGSQPPGSGRPPLKRPGGSQPAGGGGAPPAKKPAPAPAPGGPSGSGGAPPPQQPAPLPPTGSGPSGTQAKHQGRKKLPDEARQCVCGGTTLSLNDVKNALTEGSSRISGTKAGKYPEAYNNQVPGTKKREVSFPGNRCASNNIFWYEYPVFSGQTYTGGSPGAYRVVWTLSNDFCGCIVHPSQSSGAFVACTD